MKPNPSPSPEPPILVIGLGNPILGDDGAGWKVAEQVRSFLAQRPEEHPLACEVDCLSVGGLRLMERMVGYDTVILIDAMTTGAYPPGSVIVKDLKEIPNRAWGHLTSAHDTTLQNALEIGRKMGAPLPQTIWVIGIEAHQVYEFSEELTPEIAKAIPAAAQQVMQLLSPFWQALEGKPESISGG